MPNTSDRVLETTTTTGTGTINLDGAVAGYVTFVAGVGTGKLVPYAIVGGTEWETGLGTVTDATPDTLARTKVLRSSNAGAAVNFSAGTKQVFITIVPEILVVDPGIAGGRLTASSTLPVTTADTKSTILYYLPYVGDKVALYDGTSWRLHTIPSAGVQLTIDGVLTAAQNYDIFLYDNAGTLTLDAEAWSTHTAGTGARGSNVPVRQDGAWVKTGTLSRRYLGTIRTIDDGGAEKCQDAAAQRLIWNVQNRVLRHGLATQATSWTYSTPAFRSANGTTGDGLGVGRVEVVIGIAEDVLSAFVSCGGENASATGSAVAQGVGIDSNTANSAQVVRAMYAASIGPRYWLTSAEYVGVLAAGFHFVQWLEYGAADMTTSWYANVGSGPGVEGMVIKCFA